MTNQQRIIADLLTTEYNNLAGELLTLMDEMEADKLPDHSDKLIELQCRIGIIIETMQDNDEWVNPEREEECHVHQ